MEMNISASQCSSGCESGWTLYLDQSYISENKVQRDQSNIVDYEEQRVRKMTEEEEEDLSMVSDASSGPPQYYDNKEEESFYENGCSFSSSKWASKLASKGKKKKKNKEKTKIECTSQLDDTASSHVYQKNSTTRNVWDFSESFSETQFQGKSAYEKQFGLMQLSQRKNSASEETRYFKRGDW